MSFHTISIPRLAKEMQARKDKKQSPYLLFLGAGASVSSGAPQMSKVIDQYLIDSGVDKKTLRQMNYEMRFGRFLELMKNESQSDRSYWLYDLFKDAKPSSGYTALTKLLENDYFDVVLSTNWDSLLDRSLIQRNSKKLVLNSTFRVYAVGVHESSFIAQSFKQRIQEKKILKLHGELDNGVIYVTMEETMKFQKEITKLLKNLFRSRDLIMAGYSAADLDVFNCIKKDLDRTLVFVNPERPSHILMNGLVSKYSYTKGIQGSDGRFDTFMKKLSLNLV